MALVEDLLAKAGYVKLSSYGLALTPQGRILTLQPCVSDEGSSARVVGWREGHDPTGVFTFATTFAPPAPAPAPVMAPAVATPGPRTPASRRAGPPPLPGVRAVDADDDALWSAALVRARQAADVASPPLAHPKPMIAAAITRPVVAMAPSARNDDNDSDADEDEWEWQLALARAKVAAEATEAQMQVQVKRSPVAVVQPAPVARAVVQPAPVARAAAPAAPVARAAARSTSNWKPPVPPTRRADAEATERPSLPVTPLPLSPPRRVARGTGPVHPQALPAVRPAALATNPRPLPLPPEDDVTAVDRTAAPSRQPAPSPLPRLSARR